MEALGIDFKLFLAQIVNFLIFFYLFKKFIAKSFLEFLKNQEKSEQEKEAILSRLKIKEEEIKVKEEEILKKAKAEAKKILEEARREISEERKKVLEKAEKEAAEIRKRALRQIEEEKTQVNQEIRSYIIKTAESLVRKVLSEVIDKNYQEKLVEEALKRIPKNLKPN